MSARSRLNEMWEWQFTDEPGETYPFGIGLFFLLGSSVLPAVYTGLDPFGFHRLLPRLAGTLIPSTLSLLTFLIMSLIAAILLYGLKRRKVSARTVYPRSLTTVFVPVTLVYVPLLVIGTIGGAIYNLIMLASFGAAFTMIVALRDEQFRLVDQADRRDWSNRVWMLAVALIIVSVQVLNLFLEKPELIPSPNEVTSRQVV